MDPYNHNPLKQAPKENTRSEYDANRHLAKQVKRKENRNV